MTVNNINFITNDVQYLYDCMKKVLIIVHREVQCGKRFPSFSYLQSISWAFKWVK